MLAWEWRADKEHKRPELPTLQLANINTLHLSRCTTAESGTARMLTWSAITSSRTGTTCPAWSPTVHTPTSRQWWSSTSTIMSCLMPCTQPWPSSSMPFSTKSTLGNSLNCTLISIDLVSPTLISTPSCTSRILDRVSCTEWCPFWLSSWYSKTEWWLRMAGQGISGNQAQCYSSTLSWWWTWKFWSWVRSTQLVCWFPCSAAFCSTGWSTGWKPKCSPNSS